MKKNGNGKQRSNIRVGKRQIPPDRPSHTRGVHQGNATARLKQTRNTDITIEGDMASAKPTRSTGINPKKHMPIDPRMPNLTPP